MQRLCGLFSEFDASCDPSEGPRRRSPSGFGWLLRASAAVMSFKDEILLNSSLKHSWQVVGFEPTILWRLPFRLQVILSTKEGANPFKRLDFRPFLLLVLVDHLSEQTCSSSHLSHHSSPPPAHLTSSTCLGLGSIKSSHAPRGPAGPPNASGALRGNGAFTEGEEPLEKGVKVAPLSGYLSR